MGFGDKLYHSLFCRGKLRALALLFWSTSQHRVVLWFQAKTRQGFEQSPKHRDQWWKAHSSYRPALKTAALVDCLNQDLANRGQGDVSEALFWLTFLAVQRQYNLGKPQHERFSTRWVIRCLCCALCFGRCSFDWWRFGWLLLVPCWGAFLQLIGCAFCSFSFPMAKNPKRRCKLIWKWKTHHLSPRYAPFSVSLPRGRSEKIPTPQGATTLSSYWLGGSHAVSHYRSGLLFVVHQETIKRPAAVRHVGGKLPSMNYVTACYCSIISACGNTYEQTSGRWWFCSCHGCCGRVGHGVVVIVIVEVAVGILVGVGEELVLPFLCCSARIAGCFAHPFYKGLGFSYDLREFCIIFDHPLFLYHHALHICMYSSKEIFVRAHACMRGEEGAIPTTNF